MFNELETSAQKEEAFSLIIVVQTNNINTPNLCDIYF